MNITIIYGQSRKGSTYHITQEFIKLLPSQQHIEEIFLPTDLPHFCLGCFRCLQGLQHCPFYQKTQSIQQKCLDADLLIIACPTYCLSMSSPLKALFDLLFTNWMVHQPKPEYFHKRALIFSTAAGSGTKKTLKQIKTNLNFWGISDVKTKGFNVAAMNWESVSSTTKEKITKQLTQLAKSYQHSTKANVFLKTKLLFKVMKTMHQKQKGASEFETAYWRKNGWLDNQVPWK